MKRRPDGTFLPEHEQLSRKTIGLRVSESRISKLEQIAAAKNVSITELAREVIHRYIDETDLNSLKTEPDKELKEVA